MKKQNRINEFINNKPKLYQRIDQRVTVELQRQKSIGKEFLSDQEIDDLIDKILREEIDNNKK